MPAADTPQTMPSHWTPEYLAEFHGGRVAIVAICYIVLNTLCVILRFISRYFQRCGWGWDDLLVLFSWLLNVVFCVSEIIHVRVYGAGHHSEWYALHPDLLAGYGYIAFYIQTSIYCVAVVAPRLAVLLLYLKIFTKVWMRRACFVIGLSMTALAIACLFTNTFTCTPRARLWDESLEGHCINATAFYVWATFPNFVFDFLILILPAPVVWQLQAPRRVKAGLLFTLAIGSLGIITSIIRWSAYFNTHFVSGDQPWYVDPLEILIMTEITTYLMCACLLTYRTLFRKIADTEVATSIHRFLLRSAIYGSFVEHGTGSSVHKTKIGSDVNGTTTLSDDEICLSATAGPLRGVDNHVDGFDRAVAVEFGQMDKHHILVTREFTVT